MKIKFNKYMCILIASIALMGSLLSSCVKYAGGSEIGNPVTVAGVIVDSLGNPAQGIKMYLIDRSKADLLTSAFDSGIQTVSNAAGEYAFAGVLEGAYNLFGSDSTGNEMFLTQITIETSKSVDLSGDLVIMHDTNR